MLPYFSLPYGRAEDLSGSWIVAAYLISEVDYQTALKKVGNFAVGQSVGTWVPVPGMTEEMIKYRQGRVVSFYEVPSNDQNLPLFILRLAFPSDNFGNSLTMLMTALVGNDVSTALKLKLLDIELVGDAVRYFESPKKGITDLRELTQVKENRPLVLNMIKPCAGFDPEQGAKLFSEVSGIVDMVKDDELLASPPYNPVVKRTELYLRESERAAERTGKKTLYLPNITDSPQKMREHAEQILELGAKACLVNFVFGGLDFLREFSAEFGDDLFIMAHYAGVDVFNHPLNGISDKVMLGILPRLMGAHAVMTMAPDRNNNEGVFHYYETVQAQRLKINGLNPVVTTIGGGMTPVNQEPVQTELGNDFIIGIGGAIQGHPDGTAEGAKTAMKAVEATSKGILLEKAAENTPEIRKALKLWSA